MPKVKFTQTFLLSVKPDGGKGTWWSDTQLHGLRLYVGAKGKKTWYVGYRRSDGKQSHHKIGNADLISIPDARLAATDFLIALARGEEPWRKKEAPVERMTLGAFVERTYGPWAVEHRRSGSETVAVLRRSFDWLMGRMLEEISVQDVEAWQSAERRRGLKPSSINRAVTVLKAALGWAVRRGMLDVHPLARLERLREDTDARVRYLSDEERARLFAALDERESELRAARERYNEWLAERDMPSVPAIGEDDFADHLRPMVLIALNTGIRYGSLIALCWSDIRDGVLTVRAAASKSGKTIRIPLNATARDVLERWRAQTGGSGDDLVFPSPKGGGRMSDCRSAWRAVLRRAGIRDFRWHDMRHDFASRLVMAGVDLNTVRELLGHAGLGMTLRYAHLAPEAKLRAVEMLD
ncbi:MAG: tyrosine-type recombinase/integrase [Synergistaceae bacterium]|nr:tyrosine-type recombinase/integrase [Synergistaceae bacterium]